MNTKSLLAGVLAVLAASAYANDQFNGEAYSLSPETQAGASTVTRAEVKADLAKAQAAGQIAYGEAGYKVPNAASTKSRAEVLADLQLWREAGLSRYEGFGEGPNGYDPGYQAALAKYAELRASPRYAELVAKFSGRS
jgi:hypothetical protein